MRRQDTIVFSQTFLNNHTPEQDIDPDTTVSPFALFKEHVPLTQKIEKEIQQHRTTIRNILAKKNERLLLIIGPCALQSPESALEYAKNLIALQQTVQDSFFIVMRAYYEKARSSVGWKGYMYSGVKDGDSQDPSHSLFQTRKLLISLAELGIPLASEIVDPLGAHLFSDLISWASIGARTVYSQPHRLLASYLPIPCGIKNSLEGSIEAACSAVKVANAPHKFLGCSEKGVMTWLSSSGNPDAHIVLRGSLTGTNFSRDSIQAAQQLLKRQNLFEAIVIDCSHGNAQGDMKNQLVVFDTVFQEILHDSTHPVRGLMIESFLDEGSINSHLVHNTSCDTRPKSLDRISHIDPCLNWQTTEQLVLDAHAQFQKIKQSNCSTVQTSLQESFV